MYEKSWRHDEVCEGEKGTSVKAMFGGAFEMVCRVTSDSVLLEMGKSIVCDFGHRPEF